MLFDALLGAAELARMPEEARNLERLGFDGAFTGEIARDPFLPLVLAAEHTERLQLGTSVAIALPRNPAHVAQSAHDLHAFSGGRLILGLGSQVRAHIERRFGVEWSHPAARMREFVLALRAIWRCWNERTPLDFRGRFYRHTLMTRLFDPGPNPYGEPRVFLAAVGPRMAEVAGEVADGVLLHSFVTERHLRETMLPAVERGIARCGRSRDRFEVCCPALVVTGATDQEAAEAERRAREHIAYYGSTPAYRRVLEAHGWGELQPRLNRLLAEGRQEEMAALVEDAMLDAFSVRAAPAEIADKVLARYGAMADRISLRGAPAESLAAWVADLRARAARTTPG